MRFFNKKGTQKKATAKLPMTGKVKKGFRHYCVAVLALTMVLGTSKQPVGFHFRSGEGCRNDYARLRHRAGGLVAEITRPVPEGKWLPHPCGRRGDYLCQGDFDPHHRLRKKTAH